MANAGRAVESAPRRRVLAMAERSGIHGFLALKEDSAGIVTSKGRDDDSAASCGVRRSVSCLRPPRNGSDGISVRLAAAFGRGFRRDLPARLSRSSGRPPIRLERRLGGARGSPDRGKRGVSELRSARRSPEGAMDLVPDRPRLDGQASVMPGGGDGRGRPCHRPACFGGFARLGRRTCPVQPVQRRRSGPMALRSVDAGPGERQPRAPIRKPPGSSPALGRDRRAAVARRQSASNSFLTRRARES